LFIYIRFVGEYFEAKNYGSLQRIIEVAIQDIKQRRAIPCSVIDDTGNVLYNKKELIVAIEEYCLKNHLDGSFYSHLFER